MNNQQNGAEYLPLMIEVLDDLIASPRWKDPDNIMPGSINELGARLNNGDKYRAIRENPKLNLLLKIIEYYEEDLNDDWMPYEIIKLELKKAFSFIQEVRNIVRNNSIDKYDQKIKEAYKRTKL